MGIIVVGVTDEDGYFSMLIDNITIYWVTKVCLDAEIDFLTFSSLCNKEYAKANTILIRMVTCGRVLAQLFFLAEYLDSLTVLTPGQMFHSLVLVEIFKVLYVELDMEFH